MHNIDASLAVGLNSFVSMERIAFFDHLPFEPIELKIIVFHLACFTRFININLAFSHTNNITIKRTVKIVPTTLK